MHDQAIRDADGQTRYSSAGLVQRLLANEPVEVSEATGLAYEFHVSWHLGLIAQGEQVSEVLKLIGSRPGCRHLRVQRDDLTLWAWVGGPDPLVVAEVESDVRTSPSCGVSLALGGTKAGIDGWRQTHREAEQALAVAHCSPTAAVQYGEMPLVIAAMHNETLSKWLRDLLLPLRSQSDGGMGLFQALRAYIDAECNHSSAAHSLGVGRHTVERRVRIAEELLGRSLRTCLPELDVALRLEDHLPMATAPGLA
jgi:hypothetical protein